MRVFLTGATGYIGSAVLDALVRAGHKVTALVRDPEKAERLAARGVTTVAGELAAPATYLSALRGAEAAVHTAFESSARGVDTDRQAIETLIGARPPILIYTSGVWVLGSTTRPADEDMPLDPAAHVAWRPSHEQMVLSAGANGSRTIVVRPGIVYGGARGIVSDLLKDALNGMMRVIGPGKNRWATVYARDLGDLYARLLEAPEAQGVFHVNDETDARVNDIVEAIAEHLSQRPDIRHMPMPEARRKLGTYADALALDQRVRSPRAKALGWAPSLSSITANVPRLFEEYRRGRN
ncbi:MAG TPA: NAD-dependent epimerase/dehydratase family protein [Vicinamibacterales bacterium]|nr:NAD-dependent epimerase/dehydratase family protein [Vicinamibacterales bacterium]